MRELQIPSYSEELPSLLFPSNLQTLELSLSPYFCLLQCIPNLWLFHPLRHLFSVRIREAVSKLSVFLQRSLSGNLNSLSLPGIRGPWVEIIQRWLMFTGKHRTKKKNSLCFSLHRYEVFPYWMYYIHQESRPLSPYIHDMHGHSIQSNIQSTGSLGSNSSSSTN